MNKTNPAIRHSFCILHFAFCIIAAPAAMIAASAGTVFNVSTVEELTNALINANAANCEIRIAAGTYDLSGVVMSPGESHLQLWKNGTTGRKIFGMGEGPEDTVLKAGAQDGVRILGAHNAIVSNLTFTGASTTVNGGAVWFGSNGGLYDCIVSNNTSTVAGGGVQTSSATTIAGCLFEKNSCTGTSASGGAIAGNKNLVVRDCVFRDNYGGNFGGAFDACGSLDRCTFTGNTARVAGGVCRPTSSGTRTVFRDCVFIGNSAPMGGVAYYGADWQRCAFVNNCATAGNGGVTKSEGLSNIFTDCAFTNNCVLGSNSYSVFDSAAAATNCVFFGNYATTTGMGLLKSCPSVVGCTISCNTGMPLVVGSTLRNCALTRNFGNRTNSNPLFGGCNLFNCLVAENIGGAHSMAQILNAYDKKPSQLFNCTVVTNRFSATGYSVASGVAVNTVFSRNVLASGTLQDIKDTTAPAMTNCLYSVLLGDLPGSASDCVQAADAGFADAVAGDYTPAWKSPLRNAGRADAAYLAALGPVDLAGNPRVFLRDGKGAIDIGCLECQQASKAMLILVR